MDALTPKRIDELRNGFSADHIDNALIALALEHSHCRFLENNFLRGMQSHADKDVVQHLEHFLACRSLQPSINTCLRVFELLLTEEERTLNGAYYTPNHIVKFILQRAFSHIDNPDPFVCDPSCGAGAFLLEATRLIAHRTGRSIISTLETNIYGCDINERSIQRAKALLTLLALQNGEDKEYIDFNLVQRDSLSRSGLFNTHLLTEFPNVQANDGFDAIVGNPPYVRYQDMPDELRAELRSQWQTTQSGSFNLYFPFIEVAVESINPTGIVGYIIPNTYFTSLAGKPLREYLANNRYIQEILDFGHFQVFGGIGTYTCITILSANPTQKPEKFNFALVEDREALDNLEEVSFGSIRFADLNNEKWRLLPEHDFANIKLIENQPRQLRDIASISYGLATLKDDVFMVDADEEPSDFLYKEYNGESYPIEYAITQPVVKIGQQIDENSIEQNTRRIIFPYRQRPDGYDIIPEEELSSEYPHCYSYLQVRSEELAQRDKGRKKYEAWYAYGRKHGMNRNGEKLLTPTFSNYPKFMYDYGSFYVNGYGVFLKECEFDIFTLQKILNSSVMDYYAKKTSVALRHNYPCYQRNFIEMFGIPVFSEEELRFLSSETRQEVIDEFLMQKYGLRPSAVFQKREPALFSE